MNYLFFQDSANNRVMYPASSLLGIEQETTGADEIVLLFDPIEITETSTAQVNDKVTLTLTSSADAEDVVKEGIIKKINSPLNSTNDGFIVIADDVNKVFCHGDIVSMAYVNSQG